MLKYKNTFFVLDFDRTLADTDRLYEVLEAVVEREAGISIDAMLDAKRNIEGEGGSFDTSDYIRHALTQQDSMVTWQQIQKQFIAAARVHDMLKPHASELLDLLDKNQLPYGVLTYGKEAWQLAKLEAADMIGIPHLVTRIKEKGVLLTGWKHGGGFIVPPAMTKDFTPLFVESIVFLDDKAVSFQSMPRGVQGILVRSPTGIVLPSQQGDVPTDVQIVTGLNGAIELLFNQ